MIFAKYLPHLYQGADHKGHRTYNMGGGGGGGPTQSTVTQTSVPEWLRPQTEAVLGAGMQEYFDATPRRVTNPLTGETTTEYDITGTKPYTPYSQNAADYFAPFSQQQQQVFGETAGMRTPGGFQTGQQMTGMAGQGGLDTVGSAFGYGGQGAGYGGQGAMFGQQAAGTGGMYERMATDPMSMQAYMSPYMQNVVEIQKQQAIEDAQRAQLGANLGAARQGTYGGARQTLAQTQREAALNKQLSDIQAQGLQSAFDQAQKSQQFGVTSGLQGLQAGISGAQTGIQGAGMGLQGVQGAQAGFGLLGRMGEQAANIGAAQQQADIARLGFQGQMGDIQQQRQQDIINQQIQNFALAQEMPSQRLSAFNALLRGYATPTSTVSQYQAQPSGLQQLAGLGTTAAGIGTIAGMGKKEGGAIKLAEGGGITDKDALESFAERASIPQLQQSMQSGELKGKEYIGAPILQNKIVNEERMKAAQAAMAGGQQQGSGSILDGLLANADQLQGITAIAEPAPVMAAGGGIVAFQAGGLSFSDVMRQATLQEQRDYQRTGVPSARLQKMLTEPPTAPPPPETTYKKPTYKGADINDPRILEAQAGRGPDFPKNDGIRLTPIQAQLPSGKEFVIPAPPAPGITSIAAPPASPAASPAAPPPPAEQKTDMATLLAEREAQQKAFIGEDPSIKKMRESLAKQGEDTLLNRMLRGSQMVFAGEQLRTRGDASGLEKVIAGEGKRAESAAEREAKLAELEGADYRRKADIYKEVAGEERKKAGTKEERAFQEKLLNRKLEVEEKLAKMRPESATAELIRLGRSKNPIDRQIYKDLTASRSGVMTRQDAVKEVLRANPMLGYKGKEKELEDAIAVIMGTNSSRGGFTPSTQQQSILDKYR
jgi:hypothetical protein